MKTELKECDSKQNAGLMVSIREQLLITLIVNECQCHSQQNAKSIKHKHKVLSNSINFFLAVSHILYVNMNYYLLY